MSEINLNFDTVIDRHNTDCLKYDFAKQRGMREDLLPLWVADMDFCTSSYVTDAITERCKHGIFGYSEPSEDYFKALSAWLHNNHSFDVEKSWLVKTPGVVFALAHAVKAFTDEGDSVLIQQPVYYPFSEVILDNNRKVVDNTLLSDENGRYFIDYEDFEKKIIDNGIKLFFLCNPHNPVGRVFTRDELIKLAEICKKHGVIIVSDEIHSDFVFDDNKHVVLASIDKLYEEFVITATAPSKTFNLAGLQISNIFIPNAELRRKFKAELDRSGYSQVNGLGIVACQAAYTHGQQWYEAIKSYINDNLNYTVEFIHKNIPKIKVRKPEGTYLVWIDFRGLGLDAKTVDRLVVDKAKLWLDSGTMFGSIGEGYQRINVACPRELLEKALYQLKDAFEEF